MEQEEYQDQIRSFLKRTCDAFHADVAFIATVNSYTSCPIFFFNNSKSKIKKYLASFINSDSKRNPTEIELVHDKDSNGENQEPTIEIFSESPIAKAINSLPTGDQKVLIPNQVFSYSNDFLELGSVFSKGKVFEKKMNTAIVIPIKIKNYFIAALGLGTVKANVKFKLDQDTDAADFISKFVYDLYYQIAFSQGLAELDYPFEEKPEELSKESLIDESEFHENLRSFLNKAAKKASEILNAYRTHVFLIEDYAKLSLEISQNIEALTQTARNYCQDPKALSQELQKIQDLESYQGTEILYLRGIDKGDSKEFPIYYHLIDKEGLGKATWKLINRARQELNKGKEFSDDDYLEAIYEVQNKDEYANHILAEKEGLKSQLVILLIDENKKVLGAIKTFSRWVEPLFEFNKGSIISLAKKVAREVSNQYAIKNAFYLENQIQLKGKSPNFTKKELSEIDKTIDQISELKKIYDSSIELSNRNILIEEYEDEYTFRFNCLHSSKLHALAINDIYFFSNTSWEFHPQMNVLLGKNGYGKSFLFRLLVAMLQDNNEITSEFFRKKQKDAIYPEIKLAIDQQGKLESIIRTQNGFNHLQGKFLNLSKGKFPILAIPEVRFLKRTSVIGGLDFRINGELKRIGADLFMDREPFSNMVDEFISNLCITYLDLKKELSTKEIFNSYKFVFLQNVVRELTEDPSFEFSNIERNRTGSGFRFEVKMDNSHGTSEPLPIQFVSQGTISVLSIFGIIYRYLESLYPEVADEEQIALKEGIVFIDEIDAHLHPSWQQRIVALLKKYFPKVQFFLSSHSPLVVGGCRSGEVAVLRKSTDNDGYKIQSYSRDFIGATFIELYQLIFEIEEMDETYLKYKAMSLIRDELEEEYRNLLNKPSRSESEEIKLNSLYEDLKIIRRIN